MTATPGSLPGFVLWDKFVTPRQGRAWAYSESFFRELDSVSVKEHNSPTPYS
jgi:hypothetical protein